MNDICPRCGSDNWGPIDFLCKYCNDCRLAKYVDEDSYSAYYKIFTDCVVYWRRTEKSTIIWHNTFVRLDTDTPLPFDISEEQLKTYSELLFDISLEQLKLYMVFL